MSSPSVSVILPTCHRADYLCAALASACAQTLPPAEILVVDDGGAEETLRPLLARAPVPVRLLPGPGAGPGAARNLGLRAASGELIAFLDDDDLWHPNKLAWQVAWMPRRPDLGLLGTQVLRSEAATPPPEPVRAPRRLRPVSRPALLHANRLATSSVLARRECFEQCGGFDETLPLAQDWELWLRISRRRRIAVLPAPLTVYRLHHHQRSAHHSEMRRWEGEVMRRALAAGDLNWWLSGVAQRRLAWAECRLGRALWRERRPQPALQALWRSVSLYPLHPAAWSALARGARHHLRAAEVPKL